MNQQTKKGLSHSNESHQLCQTILRRDTVNSGVRSSYPIMIGSPNCMKLSRQMIICRVCTGVMKCNFILLERGMRSSCGAEVDTVGLSLLCVASTGNKRSWFGMICPNAENWPMSAPRGGLPCP
ncbi:hypothetical protein PoB_007428500 [Plakobranchus ocellatus]|uniref:Uncharacterized protein n=1 Tax=Plakobranchus ocellatus TaxID=259542 RepID=A0AAV4DUX4_9GAST|nr:hypothetical protein PoB_007428500 [Plakobranchus ocellatus]